MNRFLLFFVALAAATWHGSSGAADDGGAAVPTAFARNVAPFLKTHCTGCHGGEDPEAKLALDRYRDSANIQQDYAVWQRVLKMLDERQMPPDGAPRPAETALRAVVQAIQAELAQFDCNDQKRPGRVTLRRLNRAEYNNTIRDLLGIDPDPARDFPSDDVGNGFDNIGDVLSISPILMEKYLAAAESVIEEAYGSVRGRVRLIRYRPNEETTAAEATRLNLENFATRAFRRPVTETELDRLMELVDRARKRGYSEREALKVGLQAVLVSPHFLFRVERDPEPDDPDGIRALNDYELASRLSYFLWSSMPDEELFSLARQGELQNRDVLRAQAGRMLKDEKAAALVENFAGQWLQLRSLPNAAPDPERFPDFDEPLREAMRRETEMFVETIIREDRSVLDFLDADYTFVNERLARHYGIAGVRGDEFQQVKLSEKRRGVLTHGSILLLTSNPTRTSPVKRGKWILENILGEPPPPPPDGVLELEEQTELLGSLRERMEQHRANESCAVCHRKMDALGFGLENFDAIGAWRDRDGRFEIDASGTLPGGAKFAGPKELMQVLKNQKRNEFCRSLAEKMVTYAIGRGLQPYDRCAVDEIVEQLEENDFRFSALVAGVITSDPFLLRERKGDD